MCELCIVYFFAVKMATNASSTPENFVKSTNEAQTSSNAQNSTNSQGKTWTFRRHFVNKNCRFDSKFLGEFCRKKSHFLPRPRPSFFYESDKKSELVIDFGKVWKIYVKLKKVWKISEIFLNWLKVVSNFCENQVTKLTILKFLLEEF